MYPQRNPEAIIRLSALIRSLARRDEYKHLCHYASLIAELQDLHDAMNDETPGTRGHFRAHEAATKTYHAARSYALKWKLEPPSIVMSSCGYTYSNPKVTR